MKIRNWILLFCSLSVLWSGSPRELRAGQTYQRQVTVFGQSSAPSAPTQAIDPAEEADIRELMDLMEAKATFTRMVDSMANNIRPLLLNALPPGPYRERLVQLFFEKFRAKVSPQYFLDLAVPIYAQYLSDAEIKGLIQFYKTPLGQKWISVQPKVAAGVSPTAHSWGVKLGSQTMQEVLQEHPDLAEELKEAEHAAHAH